MAVWEGLYGGGWRGLGDLGMNGIVPIWVPGWGDSPGDYIPDQFRAPVGQAAAQPPDMSGQFNTQLPPDEEAAFQAWLSRSGRAGDLYNYDLRGAWKANARAAANGHLPDTWKKPNHPTFSNESIYSTNNDPGGRWVQSGGGNNWGFWASPADMRYQSMGALADYFRRKEPDSTVIFPSDYRLPRGR